MGRVLSINPKEGKLRFWARSQDSLYGRSAVICGRLGAVMQQTVNVDRLTPLERQIVSMVGQGFRDWHIDEAFWMTRQTLSAHLRSIFDKLGVADQAELAQVAVRLRS